VGLLEPIRDYIDTLVHPSAQHNALTRAQHRAFIAPRLLGSFGALAVLPIYLVVRGVPSALEVLAIAWLLAPILSAYLLSRTGHHASAQLLFSASLIGLIVAVAALTGGISSFVAIFLVVVPLEAAPCASRRIIAIVSMITVSACGLLISFSMTPWLTSAIPAPPAEVALAAFGVVSATLYSTGLALGTQALVGASSRMFSAEKSKYWFLAHNMTDVITRHGRNGATLFVSPGAELVFGASPDELLGHGLFDRIHVLDRPAYLTALAEASAFGGDRSVEFRVRRDQVEVAAPGTPQFIWIEMRCRLLNPSVAEPFGVRVREVVAVLRDVTERKVQELALEQARTEIELAHIANSRFLTMMSHELRTPLNVIIGFSEMLLNESQWRLDSERRREYASLIKDSGTHLLAVVNAISDTSRFDNDECEIRPESFALAAMIESCRDLLTLKAHECGVNLSVRIPGTLPDVVSDKRAVKQILIALVSNAVKFTDRGGRVIVSVAINGPTFAIMVEDSGIGIAEDDLSRPSDPFYQAWSSYDHRHDAPGLDLSIVKRLSERLGGEMTISSRVGEGTRVSVRLPLDCEQRRRVGPAVSVVRLSAVAHMSPGVRPNEVNTAVRKRAYRR
jgi:two-component system, cell cycle sensor histidine kinase DivJ